MGGRIHHATLGNLPSLLRGAKPIVVDFWASWCAPCHVMGPLLKDLAEEFDGRIVFAKVNVQQNRDLAEQFKINTIPTLLFFKNGKQWDRLSGLKGRSELRKLLEKLAS